MWTTRLVPRVFKPLSSVSRPALFLTAQRDFCFRWQLKHRDVYSPKDWNYKEKKYDTNHRMGKIKYKTQDPLFIDRRLTHIDGGVASYITRLHDEKLYDIPLRNMAFILYNEAKDKRNERIIYRRFEENYHNLMSTKILPRESFGGLWACYESNLASLEGIKYWEATLEEHSKNFHSTWITELLQAFNNNKQLGADHMNGLFDKYFKPRLLEIWDEQLLFNQRTISDFITEFKKLNYYDAEIFEKFLDTLIIKKRIQNIYFFENFHQFFNEVNENPKGELYNKLGDKIKQWEEKHYTEDFKWRYNLEERRRRTHKELVARRDDKEWADFEICHTKDEREELERQRIEAEQQLKYAVYNEDLFVKKVKEFRAEGMATIEMMVLLGCDEEQLEDAYAIISKEEQQNKLEELRKQNKLPFGDGATV